MTTLSRRQSERLALKNLFMNEVCDCNETYNFWLRWAGAASYGVGLATLL